MSDTTPFDANRELWDAWTEIHEGSAFYDVEGFRAGETSLRTIELERVGDVTGLRLLHLQCHFGLDTLSWARRGARVTGVDFSPRAIRLARSLADELDLDAEFVQSDVRELPAEWSDRFDLVYTSYGVLTWLPDLREWASAIRRVLRPGGALHLVEFHPFGGMVDAEGRVSGGPYFHTDEPARYDSNPSYTGAGPGELPRVSYEWAHPVSDVITAVVDAGLTLEAYEELPWSPYGFDPFTEEHEPGRWRIPGLEADIPLVYYLRGRRPVE
jgi:SAM-dependent methyltransferase